MSHLDTQYALNDEQRLLQQTLRSFARKEVAKVADEIDREARYPQEVFDSLPGLASGELRAAISITEPGVGSDVAGLSTRADRCEGGYELTGTKIFCTNAAVADFVVVAAKTDTSVRHGGISVFIVERGTPGFEVTRNEHKLGARGVPSSELQFDRAFVPQENLLGILSTRQLRLWMKA